MFRQIILNVFLLVQENIDEVWFYIRDSQSGIKLLQAMTAISAFIMLVMSILLFKADSTNQMQKSSSGKYEVDHSTTAEVIVEIKHVFLTIVGLLHAITMLLLAKSKVKDVSYIYASHVEETYNAQQV